MTTGPSTHGHMLPQAGYQTAPRWATWLQPSNTPSDYSMVWYAVSSIWGILCIGLTALAALGYVWAALHATEISYERSATHRLIQQLEHESRVLAVQETRLASSARIDHIARTRLGMIAPRLGQVAVLQ